VVYAYVSDVTEPQDRAKSMGMLGAAFGLGFHPGFDVSGLTRTPGCPEQHHRAT